MSQSDFTVEVFQNEYLPDGGRDVNAIVTVTAPDSPPTAAVADGEGRAEIIIVDCSGSMDYPQTKIAQARQATQAAIDVIRDGVAFALIAGVLSAAAIEATPAAAGQHCRMEKQCRWVNFKKICTYVKVCRDS